MPFLHSLHTNDGKAEGTPWDDWQGTFAESSSLAGAVVVVVGSTDLYDIPLLGKQYQIPTSPVPTGTRPSLYLLLGTDVSVYE